MEPKYQDNHVKVYNKSCTDMSELLDESVQCVVTSPPYYGLRKYQGEQDLIWGGENHHEHTWGELVPRAGYRSCDTNPGPLQSIATQNRNEGGSNYCQVCGAWRGAFGLEPSPELYVSHLIEILREIRRVLRKDGTLFLNLGDSYASGGKSGEGETRTVSEKFHASPTDPSLNCQRRCPVSPGLKPKDLCLIPFRVAIAAQEDGWWVRSVIIWSKNNPMPESVSGSRWARHRVRVDENGKRVTKGGKLIECPGCPECAENDGLYLYKGAGRPTESHEYILLLTKSADYYWDMEAVREPNETKERPRLRPNGIGTDESTYGLGCDSGCGVANGRNLRSVWSFPTQPYPEAHFACVDAETECLTQEGWKSYADLSTKDVLAAYDMESRCLRWAACEDVAKYTVTNQTMVGTKHRSLDMLLTPNHRCLVHRRSDVETIRRADTLSSTDAILIAAEMIDSPGEVGVAWAELVGWYLAEGYQCKSSDSVEIYQNEPKADRIRTLLRQVSAEWNEACYGKLYRGKPTRNTCFRINGYVACRLRELCPNKAFPSRFLNWSQTERAALLDGLVKGDGCEREDGRRFFCQKDRARIDNFQALAVTLGYGSVLSNRAGGTSAVYLTNSKHRALHTSTHSLLYQTTYSGVVWCPRTQYGTFVARRNGKVFITGNTFPEELPERCIKAGTPEYGCCDKCGRPYERIIEPTGHINKREPAHCPNNCETKTDSTGWAPTTAATNNWKQACKCSDSKPVPSLVLDPFAGSGTTLWVAKRLNRKAVGYELSAEYCELIKDRNRQQVLC